MTAAAKRSWLMKKNFWPLTAAMLLFSMVPFFAAAQETEEHIETGRFGAVEPDAEDSGPGDGTIYNDNRLFLGFRLGASLGIYIPEEDTGYTGGDSYGIGLNAAIQGSFKIVPIFSIQAEAVLTGDKGARWQYTRAENGFDIIRYRQQFTGYSLQFPLIGKLNFYPGKFTVSPFFGPYFILPLGKMETDGRGGKASYSYSFSPPLGLLGGVSVGFPLGPGMIFADLRYTADLGEPELEGGGGMKTYRRHLASLSLGYEFGFLNKRQKREAQNE
jgi:hypothetical protein